MLRPIRSALAAFALAASVSAQELEPRHELGQRLVRMERAYAAASADARLEALPHLERAVAAFFRSDEEDAARSLDQARRRLLTPGEQERTPLWLDGVAILPERRVIDPEEPFTVRIERFYGDASQAEGRFHLELASGSILTGVFALGAQPTELTVTVPVDARGDRDDRLALVAVDETGARRGSVDVGLSLITDLEDRLDHVTDATVTYSAFVDSRIDVGIDSAAAVAAVIEELYAGSVLEADVPAAHLLRQLEEELAANGLSDRATDGERPEARRSPRPIERWISVRGSDGRMTPCRFLDAGGVDPDTLPPLIVALHGAGGSEHMVFDGFGAGALIERASKRGWSVLAPRIELGKGLDVSALVETVATEYAFDGRRVALVGHSMGAGLAIATVEAAAEDRPNRWRALVAIGGGRAPKSAAAFDAVHVLAGGGSADFGLRGARALHSALTARTERPEAVLTRMVVAEGAEHLTAVQASLSAVFELLDEALESGAVQESDGPGTRDR